MEYNNNYYPVQSGYATSNQQHEGAPQAQMMQQPIQQAGRMLLSPLSQQQQQQQQDTIPTMPPAPANHHQHMQHIAHHPHAQHANYQQIQPTHAHGPASQSGSPHAQQPHPNHPHHRHHNHTHNHQSNLPSQMQTQQQVVAALPQHVHTHSPHQHHQLHHHVGQPMHPQQQPQPQQQQQQQQPALNQMVISSIGAPVVNQLAHPGSQQSPGHHHHHQHHLHHHHLQQQQHHQQQQQPHHNFYSGEVGNGPVPQTNLHHYPPNQHHHPHHAHHAHHHVSPVMHHSPHPHAPPVPPPHPPPMPSHNQHQHQHQHQHQLQHQHQHQHHHHHAGSVTAWEEADGLHTHLQHPAALPGIDRNSPYYPNLLPNIEYPITIELNEKGSQCRPPSMRHTPYEIPLAPSIDPVAQSVITKVSIPNDDDDDDDGGGCDDGDHDDHDDHDDHESTVTGDTGGVGVALVDGKVNENKVTRDASQLLPEIKGKAECDGASAKGSPEESQLSQLRQQCANILGEQQRRGAPGAILIETIKSTGVGESNNNNQNNTMSTNNNSNNINNNNSLSGAQTNSTNNNNGNNGNGGGGGCGMAQVPNCALPQNGRSKRLRTSFKHNQLKEMKRWFSKNQNPDAKDLKTLAQTTGLTKRVLQVWFQNARAKFRRNNAKANLYNNVVNQHTSHLLQFQQSAQTLHHHHHHHHQVPNNNNNNTSNHHHPHSQLQHAPLHTTKGATAFV